MLITVLGFLALKLFISFSLYETPLVPTRLQSIYEFFYGFILQTVCDQTGSKVGEKFMPAYLTLFFTVLSANVIALFPYTYSITSQLVVTFTIVPVPGEKPAKPYWTFHAVSVPFAVHPKSAELDVILVAVKVEGATQAGAKP